MAFAEGERALGVCGRRQWPSPAGLYIRNESGAHGQADRMNYLAHVLLSHHTPAAITGAMLGDFIKGRPPEHWDAEVRNAILLHRAIDRYTDAHPLVGSSRSLVSTARRRFAGILIDIFYDHFLARHWASFHRRPLAVFTRHVYGVLLPQRPRFPARLQRILPWMAQDDWLASYAEVRAVGAAVNGVARRFRYPERARVLHGAVEELQQNYDPLEQHFLEFFEDLRSFANGTTEGGRPG